eukprot:9111832-Ditylum_brightwellii.AAC.1
MGMGMVLETAEMLKMMMLRNTWKQQELIVMKLYQPWNKYPPYIVDKKKEDDFDSSMFSTSQLFTAKSSTDE